MIHSKDENANPVSGTSMPPLWAPFNSKYHQPSLPPTYDELSTQHSKNELGLVLPDYSDIQPTCYSGLPVSLIANQEVEKPPPYFQSVQHQSLPSVTTGSYRQLRQVGFSIFAVVATVLCTGLTSLICIIPGLVLLSKARHAHCNGDEDRRHLYANLSVFCNFLAILWVIIVLIAVTVPTTIIIDSMKHHSDV